MQDKFETLFKPEIQEELLLRASIGSAAKDGLRFFEIHCNPTDKNKLPKGFAESYIFVTSDEKKAQLAAEKFNKFLADKAAENGCKNFPGLNFLYEIQGRNLKSLSASSDAVLEEIREKFMKKTEGLEAEAEGKLSDKNKKLLFVMEKNITRKAKSPAVKNKIHRVLLKNFYRAQAAGLTLSAQVYDKNAPSHRQVKLSASKENKERER